MSYWGFRPYVSVAERRRRGGEGDRETQEERPCRRADRHRGSEDRQELLGQGLVRQSGALFRLREPAAARADLCRQRLGDRPEDRPRQAGGAGQRLRDLQSEDRHRGGGAVALEGDLRRLRGLDRVADRTPARQAVEERDGARLQARPTACSPRRKRSECPAPARTGRACASMWRPRSMASGRGSTPIPTSCSRCAASTAPNSSRPSAPTCR